MFTAVPSVLCTPLSPSTTKTFVYRCINLLVSALIRNEKVTIFIPKGESADAYQSIDSNKVIHRESYHAFAVTTVRNLHRIAGDYITPSSVPGLKWFP